MSHSKNEKLLPDGYVAMPGTVRPHSKITTLRGPADAAEIFNVTIVLRRRTDGPQVPDFDYYANTPPEQRQRMPAEEFAAKYGAHPDDIAGVVKFADGAGLKVIETHAGRRIVKVSGTAAAMSKAFAVDLGIYEHTYIRNRKRPRPVKTTYRGADGPTHVPAELAPVIIGVFGLDNRKIGHRASTGDPAITNPLSITEIMQAYNFPAPGPTITQQTIGVIALTWGGSGYIQSDMDQYFGSLGIVNKIIPVKVDGFSNPAFSVPTTVATAVGQNTLTLASTAGITSGMSGQLPINGNPYYINITSAPVGNTITVDVYDPQTGQEYTTFPVAVPAPTSVYFNLDGETTQDIAIAGAAAAGANVAVYFSEDTETGWVDLIHQAIHPLAGDLPAGVNSPSVLTSSWSIAPGDDPDGLAFGDANWQTGITQSLISTMTLAFQDAAINAMTICMDTDDYGSNMLAGNDNTGTINGDGYAHVVYPATDPWVLAVGGTTLGKYLPAGSTTPEWVEYVWNDPGPETGIWGTGGGGISDLFPVPSYQAGAGLPVSVNTTFTPPAGVTVTPPAPFNTNGRGTPDVAGNASLNSGYLGIMGGATNIGNGTSASTPLWSGLIATINSNLGYNVGFINPLIYQWGPGVFSPINPIWPDPAYPQLANCPPDNSNNGIPGYKAGAGWDACTGLGSPNGTALLQKFQELGQAFIYGGYQSADIILYGPVPANPAVSQQIPIGGAPGGPWDTLLVPGADYAFSAQVHNSSSTQPAYIDAVSFWAVPGGVSTAGGTLLDTVGVAQSIPPGGSITVTSTQPFVNPGSHMCAVVSIYSTASGWTFNGAADNKSQDIPNPGATGSHSGSAWRNTDSSTGSGGGSYRIKLGFEPIGARFHEPVILDVQAVHVPHTWNYEPRIKQLQTILDMAGAKSNFPLFMLPEFINAYPLARLKNRVSDIKGGKIAERENGKWYITPENTETATSFVVAGEIPETAKKGDIIVVDITANYPKTGRTEARAVGFKQFIYIK